MRNGINVKALKGSVSYKYSYEKNLNNENSFKTVF